MGVEPVQWKPQSVRNSALALQTFLGRRYKKTRSKNVGTIPKIVSLCQTPTDADTKTNRSRFTMDSGMFRSSTTQNNGRVCQQTREMR